MISNGNSVDVISMSLSTFFEGPGDGTDNTAMSALDAVDEEVRRGIVLVSAAGNCAAG